MSVELWKDDKCLGIVSERVVEYIDNLEAERDALAAWFDNLSWAGKLQRRIPRLHRWLRQARERHQFVLYGLGQQAATLDAYQRRAAMADELAAFLLEVTAHADDEVLVDEAWTLRYRYDAAKEDNHG